MAHYEDRGLDIGSFSDDDVAISSAGMESYIESLRANLLETVRQKIEAIDGINNALNSGWQGISRDKFDEKFTTVRTKIIEDLEAEFQDLRNRLKELQTSFFNQDFAMVSEE